MNPCRIAAAQFQAVAGDLGGNLIRAKDAVHRARETGARVVVLPECCLSGYDLDWVSAGAPGGGRPIPGPALKIIAGLSRNLGIAVVVNDLERAGTRLFSTSVVLDAGTVLTTHRKCQLTQAEEAAGLRPGDSLASPIRIDRFPVPLAPMVCFEHGFPELALALALDGAGVIAISSAIRNGYEHLRGLRTRARAQDNGLYVVAANAVGGGYCGASMIVDPRGEVMATASDSESDVIFTDIDPELIARQRQDEPVLQRRRPELYG